MWPTRRQRRTLEKLELLSLVRSWSVSLWLQFLKTLLIQVGLVPLASLLDAAEFYMEKEGLMVLEEDQKVAMVMNVSGRKIHLFTSHLFSS